MNETLLRAIKRVAHYAKGALLDIGSGKQPYRDIFEPRVESYLGFDRPTAQYYSPRTRCYGDARMLPFRQGTFDTVVSFEVLEHVPDPFAFFTEVARVLTPGGHLLLTTPHMWGIHDEPNDFYRFTPYGLRYLCDRHDLSVVMVEPVAGYWVTAGARFSCYLERFRHLQGLVGCCAQFAVQKAALFLDGHHCVRSDAWNHLLVARRFTSQGVT